MDQVQFQCDNELTRASAHLNFVSSGISALERKTDESSVRWPVLEEGTCSSALIIARAGRVCRMISSTTIWDWLSSCVPAFSVCSTTPDTVRSCDPSCVVLRVSDPRRCSESTRSQRLHLYAVQAIYHACRNLICMPS